MPTPQARISKWENNLTPHIVDHLAKLTPDAPYALYPNSPTTYADGYRTVSYKDLANAVNGLARWIEENLGRSETFEVLAYIGSNDIRYIALVLAAVKTGYVAFLTSPRNSVAAHGALFEELKCKTILSPSPTPPPVEGILKAFPEMKNLHVPSVEDLIDTEYEHFSWEKTFEEARWDPLGVIHTSGSTGTPKPLIWTHESIARHMNIIARDPPTGFDMQDSKWNGRRLLNSFPPFHAACLGVHLIYCLPFGLIPIAPISGAIPTAEGMVEALKAAPADAAFLIPSIAADLAQNPELLDYCAENLEIILYAGGDLPQALGDKIAAKIPFRCQYGASEVGLAAQIVDPGMSDSDWHWMVFHPDLGVEFEEITPGNFEMILKRDPKYEPYQLPFTIKPSLLDLDVYRTKDLFEKHPLIPNCWSWKARADDIIVFLNGEKTNPVTMEQQVASHDKVAAALVVGMQKFQAGLIVEPAATVGNLSAEEEHAFVDEIWSLVEEANKETPAHARIEKSMILLTSPEKPMIRSGKGTIQRQGTVALYAGEIDELYARVDAESSDAEKASINVNDAREVSDFIQQAIQKINPDLLQEGVDNFFSLGMDSLMALRLVRALRHGLGRKDLSVSVVHDNPSVAKLTQYFVGDHGSTSGDESVAGDPSELEMLLERFKGVIEQTSVESQQKDEIVVLTGSTGSLGTQLLMTLLSNPTVSHIYCLNRRKTAQEIHEAKAKAAGFDIKQHLPRLTFLQATLDQPSLGLSTGSYEIIRSTSTLIIHNAWPVNFILPLSSFHPHITGLTNIFQLASTRRTPPKILYISSVSSVAQAPNFSSIPEKVITDLDAPYQMGYGKSKLLAELICDAAARRLNIPVSFARLGQIAGPVHGVTAGLWNTTEWLPSLIRTSICMGLIPDDLGPELGRVDWIPVDVLAGVLVDLGLRDRSGDSVEEQTGAEVYNILNPKTMDWKDLIPAFVDSIQKHAGERIEVVSAETWLERLRKIANEDATEEVVSMYPAIKLQEFYETRMLAQEGAFSTKWEIKRALERSETLRKLNGVRDEWVDRWVEGWVGQLTT